MPIVKPVEEELQQILLPSTKDAPIEDDRLWVVLDVSPAMGRDLATVERRDTTGVTLMKGVLARMREWNLFQEDGTPWPITFETMQTLLTMEDISFLSDQVKNTTAPQPLAEPEKKA